MGNLIVKDNALIEASHKLGEVEQRLILLAILKARDFCDNIEQLKDKELTIHANDYINTFNVERQGAYKALKQAVLGLYRAEWGYRYVNSRGNLAVRYERFTQSAEYIENEATVKFMFANAIIPMLVELERAFTTYEIGQVAKLQSRYSMRLYECLIRFKSTKVLKISLEELRFRFGLLNHEYIRMSDFKKDVLDLSIKQINKYTDIDVTYEQQKEGRKIVGFIFNFKQKKDKKKSDDDNVIFNLVMTNKQRLIFAKKLANLTELGSYAPVGASIDEFAEKIAHELLDPAKSDFYKPFLEKIGFKGNSINDG